MGCSSTKLAIANPLHENGLVTKTKENTNYMTFKDQTFQAKIV